MAKNNSDITTSKGDTAKGNRRKKNDNSNLLPVAIDDQSSIAKSTKVVARRNNPNDELVTNCDRFITAPQIESMILFLYFYVPNLVILWTYFRRNIL